MVCYLEHELTGLDSVRDVLLSQLDEDISQDNSAPIFIVRGLRFRGKHHDGLVDHFDEELGMLGKTC